MQGGYPPHPGFYQNRPGHGMPPIPMRPQSQGGNSSNNPEVRSDQAYFFQGSPYNHPQQTTQGEKNSDINSAARSGQQANTSIIGGPPIYQ